ncbi:MAG: formate/nitrite transporter family protein [Thermoleophilia bacterium]
MSRETRSNRPDAREIYQRVASNAEEQLERSSSALAFSALLAGFTLGATPLAYVAAIVLVDGSAGPLAGALLYPAGYIAVILGRAQLFTENTLYPVALTLTDRRHLAGTARLWAVVLAANLLGALLFALIATETTAISQALRDEIARLGDEAASRDGWTTFWSAVLAGWLLALVAWLVEATETSIGAFVVIWLLTAIVALSSLDHSIASAIEVIAAALDGRVGLAEALGWQGVTVLGNALGGVLIVSLVNFGQVRSGGG